MDKIIEQLTGELEEEKRKNELLKNILFELSRASSLKEKLDNILRLLDDNLNLQHTMLLLPSGDRSVLRVIASRGFEDDGIEAEVPFGQGIIGVAAAKQKKMRLSCLSQYRRYARTFMKDENSNKEDQPLPQLKNAESQVVLPLVVNGELVAVLSAESESILFFHKKEEGFLITISQQIALSIQNSIVLDQLEERVKERTARLEKLNATKDRLFSIIGHDLRSPVASLESISELILYYNSMGQQEKLADLGFKISSAAKNVSHLLDNLLNWSLSQQDEIKYEPEQILIHNLIKEVCGLYEDHLASKNISLTHFESEEEKIYADYNMTYSILRNVLHNAIKFTRPEGKIEIFTSTNEDMLKITIKDSGVGMSKEKLEKLFLFQKEKKSTLGTAKEKGTGLGMILMSEFMKRNKGHTEVKSIENEGTLVHLVFPVPEA